MISQGQRSTEAHLAALAGGEPLLDGTVVIATGAGGGIGAAVAEALARAGASVGLADLEPDRVRALGARIEAIGRGCVVGAFDASDPDAFDAFHREVRSKMGPVDGLVNCAGCWDPEPFAEASVASFQRMVLLNLQTTWTACQVVLPGMRGRGAGSIVNFASTAGEYGSVTPAAHYAAAKGGVIGFTKSLAREAGPDNVRVNALSPGPIATRAHGSATEGQLAAIAARTLLGRLGTPAEIAAGCLYLLSPLSSFVTGTVLQINGGSCL